MMESEVVHSSSISNSQEGTDSLKSMKADMVVHGAGRVPNTEGLDLIMGKIEHTNRGIKVNEYLQSISNPAVYALETSPQQQQVAAYH